MANFYKILNVSHDAKLVEIKTSFRQLALKYHPDRNQENIYEASKKFKQISEAYSVLSNNRERQIYNLSLQIKNNESDSKENVQKTNESLKGSVWFCKWMTSYRGMNSREQQQKLKNWKMLEEVKRLQSEFVKLNKKRSPEKSIWDNTEIESKLNHILNKMRQSIGNFNNQTKNNVNSIKANWKVKSLMVVTVNEDPWKQAADDKAMIIDKDVKLDMDSDLAFED